MPPPSPRRPGVHWPRRPDPEGNTDDTVRIRPAARRAAWPWAVAGAAGCALVGAFGAFLLVDRPHPPAPPAAAVPPVASVPPVTSPPMVASAPAGPAPVPRVDATRALPTPAPAAPPPESPPVVPPPAPTPAVAFAPVPALPVPIIPVSATRPAPPLQTEAEILSRAPDTREVYRFASQPEILVIQFPDLSDQARTLNRVAALIEKSGFPRDRVLPDAELDRAIRAAGEKPDTFYLGHDYRAADILRFFQEAERQNVVLTPQELWLQRQLAAWDWRPGVNGALISLTRPLPGQGVDRPARATVLRHELSHGAYFTRPDYSAYTQLFWRTVLTRAEQAAFRTFLAAEGYDTSIDDLMMNEMQAYLMHTADRRFFDGSRLGLAPDRLDTLRGLFLTGMPPGWLRDCTTVPSRGP